MKKIPPREFPKILQNIPDPPKHLYLKGDLPSHDEYTYLCVVGSRKYSDYGKRACEHILSGIAGYPIVIVSGLAMGIDAIAHNIALEKNLPTVALPGSGLDESVIYPANNLGLAKNILKNNGALISELEPTTQGARWTFPTRNRLMAGISDIVLVVEAEEKSGTKITARLALEYGRDVVVIPGSIFSKTSTGTNTLIKEGAAPITSPEDLLEIMGFKPSIQKSLTLENLTQEEKEVLKYISSPISRSELMRKLTWDQGKFGSILTEMELKDIIIEIDGKVMRK